VSRDTIRVRDAAATKGPWQWFGNLTNREVNLSTVHSGRVHILRFVRWGMNSAQPVFRRLDGAADMWSVSTVAASDVPIFEVAPDVRDASDPRVYRKDIVGLRHPDARFIAYARTDVPALLRVADAAADLLDRTDWTSTLPGEIDDLVDAMRALEAMP
jgi:hypothetical protein